MNKSQAPRELLGEPSDELHACVERLVGWFDPATSYAVALSGGVDSAVVAKAARLATSDVIAVTGRSPSVAEVELRDAQQLVDSIQIQHETIATGELSNPEYQRNDARRCYHCKTQLFQAIRARFPSATVLTGTNRDDHDDYRPGLGAAREAGVRAPLAELGIGKDMVRRLAARWELHLADKPASPCLASRIAHGVEVTAERLAMVERAEQMLREMGLGQFRVRLQADALARIEVADEAIAKLAAPAARERVVQEFKRIGFRFVTLDLEGFRSGSLNPVFDIQRTPAKPAGE